MDSVLLTALLRGDVQYNNSFSKGGGMGDFVDNLPVACRIIAIFLFISKKMISFAKYIIEFK